MRHEKLPSLGFPDEEWDDDGDLFCRPRADVVAVYVEGSREQIVGIYARDRRCRSVQQTWRRNTPLVSFQVDCPLQALAVIQHYLDTHPEKTHD